MQQLIFERQGRGGVVEIGVDPGRVGIDVGRVSGSSVP